MTAPLISALLFPLCLGFLLLCLWGPGPRPFRSHPLLKACLAVGLALGLSSCTYFLWLLLEGPSRGRFIAGETLLLLLASGALLYTILTHAPGRDSDSPSRPEPGNRWTLPTLWVCLYVALAAALSRFVFLSLAAPHGEVDALSIWNMRARFLARGDAQWLDSLVGHLARHNHPDYPLLIPASIARWWTYLGDDPTLVPALVALLFTFATIGLASSSLGLLRSQGQGLLAGIVLAGTPFLIKHGASQYADVPVAFFVLATLVAFSLQERGEGNKEGLLAIAGLAAGFAAWTKNEGLLFVAVVMAARLLVVVSRSGWKPYWNELRMFAVGLLPILLFIVFYRTQIAPGVSPIIAKQGATVTLERLTDLSRHLETGLAFLAKALRFGHPGFVVLLVYLLLMGRRVNEGGRLGVSTAAVTLGLMLAGYFLVFIITPHGLRYQIDTSLDRLWIQLWPSIVFLFFLIVRTPEEALTPRNVSSAER